MEINIENNSTIEQNPLSFMPIGKLLRRFAIPSVIAMVVNSIYNIVDQIFIQREVGSSGNAATTVAFPLITFTLAIALLIGNGGSALASIKLGEKKKEKAEQILGNAFILLIIVSIIFCLGCILFFEPLLKFLGSSEEVLPYAKDYVGIILGGTVFMGIGSGLSGFVRADGAPKVSMTGLLAGCFLNIILDALFMSVLGMGVRGAALGTIISQFVTAVITLWYLLFKGKIRIRKKYFKLSGNLCCKFCVLGISSFITQFANALVQISMNQSLVHYGNLTDVGGDTAMTAMGIVLKTNMLLIGICVGIGTGAQPILGYNKGAGNYKRIRETYKYSIVSAVIVSFVGWMLVVFFPRFILSIYGDSDPKMITFACKAMRIFLGGVCVAGFNIVSSNYFQATGKAGVAFVMSLSRQVLALIPLIFILPRFMGLDGILYAGLLADGVALTIGIIFVSLEIKSLNKRAALS